MLPWWWPFGRVPEVTPHALAAELADQSPQLVDVRSAMEYARGHLEGAVSIPLPKLPMQLATLDPQRPVVVICLTGHRSVPATRLLRQHGFEVRQMAGGMLAWRQARLPEVGE